jgi:hypothetical protein
MQDISDDGYPVHEISSLAIHVLHSEEGHSFVLKGLTSELKVKLIQVVNFFC